MNILSGIQWIFCPVFRNKAANHLGLKIVLHIKVPAYGG